MTTCSRRRANFHSSVGRRGKQAQEVNLAWTYMRHTKLHRATEDCTTNPTDIFSPVVGHSSSSVFTTTLRSPCLSFAARRNCFPLTTMAPTSTGTFQPLRHRSGTMRERLHSYTKRTLGAGGSYNDAVSDQCSHCVGICVPV
jgi:hypothetical protein